MPDKSDTKSGQSLEVFWGSPEGVEIVWADNLHLQRVNNQYYLTFGQVRPPVAEGIERIVAEIRPVARLVVTKDALKRITDLLAKGLKDPE